ncbi:MAG: class I SAM-dependent methyltransferase [Ignavibacteriae bacterium]|nr:class I SAM-dependent methyltransferase [Ignavibacteriota bacterium]MCB9216170.1 class I SAM-dependent methyltransferase [Ignavibacteria bacterium]
MRVLNVGCGKAKREFPEASEATEIIGVDISPNSEADILHNLDLTPWPFESDSFDLIIMQDIIEHLEDVPATMNEIWRIARQNCVVRIRTPHYASYYAYNDPTHKRFFGIYAFDGFLTGSQNDLYATAQFSLEERRILFPKVWRITGVSSLANRFSKRWEQLFSFIFRPENLEFEFKAIKTPT